VPAPLIVPTTAGGIGPALLEYRADLGETLGLHQHLMVSTLATGGEAARHVLLDELRDDEQERAQWAGAYLYVRDGAQAGVQQRILTAGYEGPFGALRLSRPFAAPLQPGTSVELSWPLPVKKHLGVTGLNGIVNEALERCLIEARISLTGNGTYSYSLADFPWLTRYSQTNGLYDWGGLDSSTNNAMLSPYRYALRVNGASVTLQPSYLYSSTAPFELAVFVDGKRLVSQNGIWGYSEAGLVDDGDQAAVPLYWARAFGMVLALRHLTTLTKRDPSLDDATKQARLADYLRDRQQWAAACRRISRDEFPQPIAEAPPSLARLTTSSPTSLGSAWPSEAGGDWSSRW
jgi:hypothetical protein